MPQNFFDALDDGDEDDRRLANMWRLSRRTKARIIFAIWIAVIMAIFSLAIGGFLFVISTLSAPATG